MKMLIAEKQTALKAGARSGGGCLLAAVVGEIMNLSSRQEIHFLPIGCVLCFITACASQHAPGYLFFMEI